ncbi:hypothetical protein RhiirA4_406196, partial [Rhizophagus irregularis]
MKVNYPGCYYVSVIKHIVELRKFSASDANINVGAEKEWQVHIRLRNTDDNLDEVGMANVEQDFVRKKLSTRDGWNVSASKAGGYGAGARIFKALRDWEICLGDGQNWSGWVKTNEIHLWQNNPNGVTRGLIGYNVLNNISHYKPCRKPY